MKEKIGLILILLLVLCLFFAKDASAENYRGWMCLKPDVDGGMFVRAQPTTVSKIVDYFRAHMLYAKGFLYVTGEKAADEHGETWLQVQSVYCGYTANNIPPEAYAWVKEKYFLKVNPIKEGFTFIVRADYPIKRGINIHYKPDIESVSVTTLQIYYPFVQIGIKKIEPENIIDKREWTKVVSIDWKELGYILTDFFLEKIPGKIYHYKKPKNAILIMRWINLRERPDIKSRIKGNTYFGRNTQIKILAEKYPWYLTQFGWIYQRYLGFFPCCLARLD